MALVLTIGSVICHSSAEESKSLALSLGNNKLRPRPTMWIVVPFNFIGIHLKCSLSIYNHLETFSFTVYLSTCTCISLFKSSKCMTFFLEPNNSGFVYYSFAKSKTFTNALCNIMFFIYFSALTAHTTVPLEVFFAMNCKKKMTVIKSLPSCVSQILPDNNYHSYMYTLKSQSLFCTLQCSYMCIRYMYL